eukprot:scaffold2441_cov121-Isochrysis_galbana.AAC.4
MACPELQGLARGRCSLTPSHPRHHPPSSSPSVVEPVEGHVRAAGQAVIAEQVGLLGERHSQLGSR